MAEPDGEQQLFGRLQRCIRHEDYDGALRLCEKVLASNRDDAQAAQAMVACLIHKSQYQRALDMVSTARHRGSFALERAYCLFRLGKFQEVLSATKDIEVAQDGLLHLRAQAHYRLGHFDKAAELYRRLDESAGHRGGGCSDEGMLTNLYAACCAAGSVKDALGEHPPDEAALDASFEFLYNMGCAQLQAGNVYAAAGLLQIAEERCLALATEAGGGLDPEEVDGEAAIVRVQRGYAAHLRGDHDEAARLCKEALRSRVAEPSVLAVAANNFAAARKDRDLAESLRRLNTALTPAAEAKLTPRQLETIRLNICAILLRIGKAAEARGALEEVKRRHPAGTMTAASTAAAIEAALLLLPQPGKEGGGGGAAAEAALEAAAAGKAVASGDKAALQLLLAQVYIDQGKARQAAELLQRVEGIQGRPATVATVAALLTRSGGGPQALDFLAASIPAMGNQGDAIAVATALGSLVDGAAKTGAAGHPFTLGGGPAAAAMTAATGPVPEERLATARLAVGARLLAAGRHEAAAEAFDAVLGMGAALESGQRAVALASLVLACSWFDSERAQLHSAELPARGGFAAAAGVAAADDDLFDPETLEGTELPRSSKARRLVVLDKAAAKAERRQRPGDAAKRLRKRTRRREEYLAQQAALGKLDLNKPLPRPDPERWVPVKQRSYSKRGRKRNKFLGAQGTGDGAAKDAARFDVAAKVAARKEAAGAAGLEEKEVLAVLPPRGKKKGGRR